MRQLTINKVPEQMGHRIHASKATTPSKDLAFKKPFSLTSYTGHIVLILYIFLPYREN
jgi:hypothetical protein